MNGGRARSFERGAAPLRRTRGMVVPRSVLMVRRTRGNHIVYPLLSLKVVTPENKSISLTVIRKQVRLTSCSL